jgi:hypothetical protein
MSDDHRMPMEGHASGHGRVYQAGRDLTVQETVLATLPSVEQVAAPLRMVNLPGHTGLFVGRDDELIALEAALSRSRLRTLISAIRVGSVIGSGTVRSGAAWSRA